MAGVQRDHLLRAGVDHALAQRVLKAGVEIAQLRGLVHILGQIVVHRANARGEHVPRAVIHRVRQVALQLVAREYGSVQAAGIRDDGHDADEKDRDQKQRGQRHVDAVLQSI